MGLSYGKLSNYLPYILSTAVATLGFFPTQSSRTNDSESEGTPLTAS